MKVLVTGGTGFVGREIVQELREAGHEVRVLVRAGNPKAALELNNRYDAEIRQGSLLDNSFLVEVVKDRDAVIHLVGIITEFGDQTFENVHTKATQNLVNAALVAGVRRFIHMSALGTRARAVSRYHQTKWEAEQSVTATMPEWTIFRPSIIYGPRDKFVNLFARLSKWSPVLPILGRKDGTFQPIAVQDVARCFVRALSESRTIGEIFDLCGPERMTMEAMLRTILKVTHRKRFIVHIPVEIADELAQYTEFVFRKYVKKASPLNRDQVLMLQESHIGKGDWTAGLFKLKPKPFAEGIAEYLKAG